mmetsp:Transcript_27602/g.46755  ORF Transcript_27602/g.46755 Transcript_27602/m.46755 type:complete len:84 (-) Transcript_27602:308-559(-)
MDVITEDPTIEEATRTIELVEEEEGAKGSVGSDGKCEIRTRPAPPKIQQQQQQQQRNQGPGSSAIPNATSNLRDSPAERKPAE